MPDHLDNNKMLDIFLQFGQCTDAPQKVFNHLFPDEMTNEDGLHHLHADYIFNE